MATIRRRVPIDLEDTVKVTSTRLNAVLGKDELQNCLMLNGFLFHTLADIGVFD